MGMPRVQPNNLREQNERERTDKKKKKRARQGKTYRHEDLSLVDSLAWQALTRLGAHLEDGRELPLGPTKDVVMRLVDQLQPGALGTVADGGTMGAWYQATQVCLGWYAKRAPQKEGAMLLRAIACAAVVSRMCALHSRRHSRVRQGEKD